MDPTPPPATAATPPDLTAPAWPRAPRRLDAGRGASWWAEGWQIFTVAPLPWIGMIVVLLAINVALALVPMVGNVATTVLGPVFAGGLLLGCRTLARGQPLAFTHLFEAFRNDRLWPLAALGLLIALAFGIVAVLVFGALFFGAGGMAMFSGPVGHASGAGLGAAMAGMGAAAMLGGLLVLAAVAIISCACWFAPALVTLNRAAPVDALVASFRASIANLGALLVFGLIFIALAIVASIPMGLGWIVLGPVFAGASYASWREVFGE